MNRVFVRILSVLLISVLLIPAGLAEEDIIAEESVIIVESVEEPTEEPIGEHVEVVPEEPVEEVVETVASEAVEAVVEEAANVDLAEAVEPETQSIEENLMENSEEVASFEAVLAEVAPQMEEPAQQVVVEEGDASAKLMEGEELIPIDEAHFPDPAFRAYVLNMFGSQYYVGYLEQQVRESVEHIGGKKHDGNPYGFYTVDGKTGKASWSLGITSLQGIEYFPNLLILECDYNPISSLDVSALKKLSILRCTNCGMTSLNISGCNELVNLFCYGNQLANLDVSNCAPFATLPNGYKTYKQKAITWYERSLTNEELSRLPANYELLYYNKTARLAVDKNQKINGAGGGATNDPTGFTETPGVTITVNPGSTAKNTKATVVAAPGTSVQLSTAAGAKKFKSSNKKVAKVSKSGIVTFKKGGKVKITYKVGKKTRKVTLTVTDPTLPTAVAITPVNTAVKKGESVTLTPTVNEGANPGGYKWKSSNKKVATVKNGVVKFKKAGKVTITCTTKRGKKKTRVTFAVSK